MILPKDGSPSVTNNTGLSLRRLGIVGLLLVVAILLFAAAIEWIPDFGPWLADSVRDLVGPEWVADGETLYYNLRDLFEQERYRDAPPATMWAPEEVAVSPLTVEVEAGFYPQDFEVPGRNSRVMVIGPCGRPKRCRWAYGVQKCIQTQSALRR